MPPTKVPCRSLAYHIWHRGQVEDHNGWYGDIRRSTFVGGVKVTTPVHVIDWMPTLCALLGIPEEEGTKWDGVNVWPTLLGKPNPALEGRELYWQGVRNRSAALRQGDWKLVVHQGSKAKMELFDLAADPNEKTNRTAEQAERVKSMLKALKAQVDRDNDALPNDVKP